MFIEEIVRISFHPRMHNPSLKLSLQLSRKNQAEIYIIEITVNI